MCRLKDAKLPRDDFFNLFGRVPPRMRQYVKKAI